MMAIHIIERCGDGCRTYLLIAGVVLVNPRREFARVTVVVVSVCVCVCVSVKSHLTSGTSVRSENAVTNSVGDEGRKICGVFSDTAPLSRSSAPSLGWPYIWSAIFPADSTHAHCAYASSPKFAMDAPCPKLSLRSSVMMMKSSN